MSNKTPKEKDAATESVPKKQDANPGRITRSRLFLPGLLLLVLVGIILVFSGRSSGHNLGINGQKYSYEVADTEAAREQGLSNRISLEPNHAMLFAFDGPDAACMWMKDMKFNLDMVWLDENRKVLRVEQNVAPNTYPKSFCAPAPAKYVIELPSGSVKSSKLEVDQIVNF